MGIKLDAQLMFALLYADDAVLLAESAEDLQNLINIVDEYCRDWRMLLNLDKSKAMVVPKQVKNKTAAEVIKNEIKQAVTVRGVEVPFVNEYKYLGVWIQQDLGWKLHIAHNVSKAKAKHAVIGPILRCGPIPAALKRLVWCALVRSRLEYGAEVVTLNVLSKSLEGVQHTGVIGSCASTGTPRNRRQTSSSASPLSRRAFTKSGWLTWESCSRWAPGDGPAE